MKGFIKLFLILVNFIFIIVLFIAFNYRNDVVLFTTFSDNSDTVMLDKDSLKKEFNELSKDYNNDDIVGIISFPSIGKEKPIVQTTNNEYYLYHGLDKKESNKGSIFLDYRNDIEKSKKLLIYGHSSSSFNFPFNFLQKYHNYDYYMQNKYILIKTEEEIRKYEIFSVFVETEDFSYMETNFVDDDDYFFHINNLKDKSFYDTNVSLSSSDEILILQTCSTHNDYKKYDNKFLLIIARRV